MPKSLEDHRFTQRGATVFHPISTADKTAMAAMRAIVEPNKGRLRGTAARLAAGADAKLDVWEGMLHGFLGSVGQLSASTLALQQIGSFLSERFTQTTPER